MKYIFIVNGYPYSGKTTFEELISKYIRTYITSTVTEVKAMVDELYGISEKNEDRRKLLSDMKKECVSYNLIDLLTELKIKLFLESNNQIMFIDSREIDEIEKFKEMFGMKTIFIKNDRVPKETSNSSDANVENMKYDYVIENNSTLEELENKAKDFILQLNNTASVCHVIK